MDWSSNRDERGERDGPMCQKCDCNFENNEENGSHERLVKRNAVNLHDLQDSK